MANTIKLKRSSTASDAPTASDLEVGELAINTADAKLFTKHTDNSIKEISGSGGSSLSNVVEDTTPQLGGDLQSNGNNIDLADSDKLTAGTGGDLEVYSDGTDAYIDFVGADTETLFIRNTTAASNFSDGIVIQTKTTSPHYINMRNNAGVDIGAFGSDKLTITSDIYATSNFILNGPNYDIKWRNFGNVPNNYVSLVAETANSDTTVTLPNLTGTVPVFSTAPTSAITDGSNGQVLTTDGSGGLSFTDGPGVPSTGGTFTGDVTITNDLSVGGSVSLTGGGELVFNNGEGITNSKIQVFKQNYFSPNGLDPGEYIELVSITPTNFGLSSLRQFDITGKIVAQSENSSSAIDVNIRIGLSGFGTFADTDITYTTTQDADWIEPVLWVNSSTDIVKLLVKAKTVGGHSGDIDHLTADLTLVRDSNNSTITWNTTVAPTDITSITTGYAETVGKKTIVTIPDGAVELYHNDSKKLETTSTGASVTGELDVSGLLDVEGDIDFEGALVEKAYNLTGTALDPSNGTLQYKTLSANTTFTESFSDGESITLMINDGTDYTVTWPTMTWASGSAPTLATTGYTTVVLWHRGSLYGAVVS